MLTTKSYSFVIYLSFKDKKKLIAKLKKDPSVEYVQENYVYELSLAPNDPQYKLQWGIPKIKADKAWDIFKSDSSITVAVIDTDVSTRNHTFINFVFEMLLNLYLITVCIKSNIITKFNMLKT